MAVDVTTLVPEHLRAEQHVFVERVPLNHAFASSLEGELRRLRVKPFRYRNRGD